MKKRVVLLLLVLLFPLKVFALSDSYRDVVYDITNTSVDENKVNLYLFYGQECPHCEEERKWLSTFSEKYKDYLNVYYFEVWHDKSNASMADEVRKLFDLSGQSVPLTVIGDNYFSGYSDAVATRIESKLNEYIAVNEEESSESVSIPILGNVDMKSVSIPLVAVILGFIDGFNPCAMWVLLFLINMLFGMKDRKRSWILGITFLFISGLVYFLSMLGINFVLSVATVQWIKYLIAIFILVAGIFNFRKYFKIRKEEAGCSVVDEKKRKKIFYQVKKIMESKTFILSLVGIIVLAASINLVELACSLGFPLIFTELLEINQVGGLLRIIYLLIYIFFYMIDDMVVFIISMVTLEATGVTNKYNKLCTLISAIIMILMGILMLFKPDWLMLNF